MSGCHTIGHRDRIHTTHPASLFAPHVVRSIRAILHRAELDQLMPRIANVESFNGWIRGHVESSRPSIRLCFFPENDRRAPRDVISSVMRNIFPPSHVRPHSLPTPCISLSPSAPFSLHQRPPPPAGPHNLHLHLWRALHVWPAPPLQIPMALLSSQARRGTLSLPSKMVPLSITARVQLVAAQGGQIRPRGAEWHGGRTVRGAQWLWWRGVAWWPWWLMGLGTAVDGH